MKSSFRCIGVFWTHSWGDIPFTFGWFQHGSKICPFPFETNCRKMNQVTKFAHAFFGNNYVGWTNAADIDLAAGALPRVHAMVFSPADGILRRLRLGNTEFFESRSCGNNENSNRFGVECTFILGDLPCQFVFLSKSIPFPTSFRPVEPSDGMGWVALFWAKNHHPLLFRPRK